MIASNAPIVHEMATNFAAFSRQLNQMALELRETVATNRADITTAVKNVEAASVMVKDLAADLRSAGYTVTGGH